MSRDHDKIHEFHEFILKTYEFNKIYLEDYKKKSTEFVEFGQLFIHRIHTIRLYISAVLIYSVLIFPFAGSVLSCGREQLLLYYI
jgi:hypothetical protein